MNPETKLNLSKENILAHITQEQIFERYLNWKIDRRKKYLSPFRSDRTPTCSFYKSPSSVLYFKDWATGDMYDCFSAVMALYHSDFYETLKIIDQDFGLNLYSKNADLVRLSKLAERVIRFNEEENVKLKESKNLIFSCTIQDFSEAALTYWNQFGISQETLELYNVYEVIDVRKNGVPYMRASKDNPIFGYFFHDKVKLYRPLADKKEKWRGNCDASNVNGLEQLPDSGDLLIITKSMKDVMCLYSLGYNSIAPQGESMFISKELYDELSLKWKRIVILYDNDKAGKEAVKKIQKETPIESVFIEEYKDISDYHKNYGAWQAKTLMSKILDSQL